MLLPAFTLLVQVILAARPGHRQAMTDPAVTRPRIAVLVPAHNESAILAGTLQSIQSQLFAGDRLVVIADNCTDDTKGVAAAAGAEVIARHDPSRRGKSYALAFGVRYLEKDPPEVVLIIDADCLAQAEAIGRLARRCKATGHPVQAAYLMAAPSDAEVGTRLATLAWRLRTFVRPLGFAQLGLPCPLMGTGMAFNWDHLRSVELASGHLVEDMVLGLELARLRRAPLFAPESQVTSDFPDTADALLAQRTRWEHGHLNVILREIPRHLFAGIRDRNLPLIALILDLCVPPLTLLGVLVSANALFAAILHVLDGAVIPLALSLSGIVMLAVASVTFWLTHGKANVSLADLAYVPWYIIRKIPLYLNFVVTRQMEWKRSKRKGESCG